MFFLLPNPRYPPPVSFQDAEQEEKKEEKGEKDQKKLKENETIPSSKVRSMQTLMKHLLPR